MSKFCDHVVGWREVKMPLKYCPQCGERLDSPYEDIDFLNKLAADIISINCDRLAAGKSPPPFAPWHSKRLMEIAARLEGKT